LKDLIARQRPGWSLEQAFYTSPSIFEFERRGWLAKQWFLLAHRSEIPEAGSYILRELLGESVILARDGAGTLRGFYNVCRHRGSRICERDGRSNSLTCPYHAWSYRLDGSLRAASALSEEIDVSTLSLRSIAVRETGGLVIGSLAGDPQVATALGNVFEPGLRFHGVPNARIAARRSYPTQGNWKLVLENFIECYHCFPAHPEYCRVMKHVDAVAREPSKAAIAWQESAAAWLAKDASPGSPLTMAPAVDQFAICSAARAPIGGGRLTQSEDGRPVAPLMGELKSFDGGVSTFRCEPFIFLAALNDHAVMFQFSPLAAEQTRVDVSWLVDSTADDSKVDVARMMWLWDVTTAQDKVLIERNAAGVRSRAYVPGPYSKLESLPARFVARYLSELSPGNGETS
jgi:phenylpropionate dioxygenase-like ring-hydroxylating dioxygenase large terminal subunit